MDRRIELIIKEINRLYDEGIMDSICEEYLLNGNSMYDIFEGLDDDNILDDISNEIRIDSCIKISHGIQSLVFIFEDIVYKLTPYNLNYINDFKNYLLEHEEQDLHINLDKLICPVEEVYKGFDYSIYMQKKLIFKAYSNNNVISPITGVLTEDLANIICTYYLNDKLDLQYGAKIINSFSILYEKFLSKHLDLCEDIHNGNWAYDENGFPVIFDPFYYR